METDNLFHKLCCNVHLSIRARYVDSNQWHIYSTGNITRYLMKALKVNMMMLCIIFDSSLDDGSAMSLMNCELVLGHIFFYSLGRLPTLFISKLFIEPTCQVIF
jgi:hypothetical protein